tara:strand:+ start:4316 stop:5296 length:981 start_codon:yes stop_codon:yes gene_type:complete
MNTISNSNIKPYVLPTPNNYEILYTGKYRIVELKKIAKKYKLKSSGKKKELLERIHTYLYKFNYATKIQSFFKGYILRKFLSLHGKYIYPSIRTKCVNETDFLTLDDIKNIPFSQFITETDSKGFVYGFDICSLYNFFKSNVKPFNPYNREIFSKSFIEKTKKIIYLSSVVNIPINILLNSEDNKEKNPKIILNRRIEKVFQQIDELGNITNSDWFINISKNPIKLVAFARQLKDIIDFRLQITQDIKINIYPPNGDIFNNINLSTLPLNSLENICSKVVLIMERLVLYGIDDTSKNLGSMYLLTGLTLVSQQAAEALPWLYQSVA